MNERDLDREQAADHLQMVDRILSRADDRVSLSGSPFIIWGFVAAVMNLGIQMFTQRGSASLLWISVALLLMALSYMVYFTMVMRKQERRGLLDRHIGNVFLIAWIVALFVTTFANHLIAGWTQAAVWSMMFGAAMMYCASLARSAVVFAGGVVMILSIVVANYFLHDVGYIIAAGDIIGMCGAGFALMLARGKV